MNDLLPYLQILNNQQANMVTLVEALCNINSGTFNVVGLDNIKQRLVKEFSVLDGKTELHDCPPLIHIDDSGNPIPLVQMVSPIISLHWHLSSLGSL